MGTYVITLLLTALGIWEFYEIVIKYKFNYGPVITPEPPSFRDFLKKS
jgi:hypothetical protein